MNTDHIIIMNVIQIKVPGYLENALFRKKGIS